MRTYYAKRYKKRRVIASITHPIKNGVKKAPVEQYRKSRMRR